MVFSVGNIKPLLAIDMPHCFGGVQPYSCSQSTAHSITYVEASGGAERAGLASRLRCLAQQTAAEQARCSRAAFALPPCCAVES